jgi:hypothetical protein
MKPSPPVTIVGAPPISISLPPLSRADRALPPPHPRAAASWLPQLVSAPYQPPLFRLLFVASSPIPDPLLPLPTGGKKHRPIPFLPIFLPRTFPSLMMSSCDTRSLPLSSCPSMTTGKAPSSPFLKSLSRCSMRHGSNLLCTSHPPPSPDAAGPLFCYCRPPESWHPHQEPLRSHHPPPHCRPASTVSFRPCNLARPIAPTSAVPTPSTTLSESRRRLFTSHAATRGRSAVTALGARSHAGMGWSWAILATGPG